MAKSGEVNAGRRFAKLLWILFMGSVGDAIGGTGPVASSYTIDFSNKSHWSYALCTVIRRTVHESGYRVGIH